MRNLPTIHHILAEAYQDAVEGFNNTLAGQLKSVLEELRNVKNIAMIIGIMQILEVYTKASLAAQHLVWFPTQVWQEINKAKEKISALSEKWIWEETNLKLGGIGSPKMHVENLRNGVYRPFVPENSIRQNRSFLMEHSSHDEAELGRQLTALFDEEEQITLDLAGEIPIEGEIDVVEPQVTSELRKICASLSEKWNERQKETELQKATISAFSVPHDLAEMQVSDKLKCLQDKLRNVTVTSSPSP